jgi:EmrB/QacA subfamily drug resistance transporter
MVGIDAMVLSLALPNLAVDLSAPTSQLQWFADAYLLAVAATMLPAGLLGDRLGRKRVLLAALTVFGIGSLTCAYASSAGALIVGRVVLGIAAGILLPLSLSVLPVLFGEDERQRALAIVAGASFVAYPVGPILGGWLLNHYWWGSVFIINVPIVAAALLVVALAMPESRGQERARPDWLGIVLSSGGLFALTYGMIRAGEDGWGERAALAWIVAGAVALAGFAAWQRWGTRSPLVDVALFRSRSFTVSTVLTMLLTFALFGLLFAVPQYYRAVLGYDAMDTGLWLLPLVGGLAVGLGAGDRVSRKAGPKTAVVGGFAVCAAAMALGAFTDAGQGVGYAATWLALGGAGFGITMPPAVNAALSELTGEATGVGSGLVAAIRQVGSTLGVAVLGSVLNSAYRSGLQVDGLPAAAAIRDNVAAGVAVAERAGSPNLLAMVQKAFVDGMDAMLVWSGLIAAASAVLALVALPRRARQSAQPSTSENAAAH